MKLYPNPSSGNAVLEVEEPLTEDQTVRIYDQIGRMVAEQPMSMGLQKLQLQTSHLAEGVYIVRLTGNSDVRTSKLVVNH